MAKKKLHKKKQITEPKPEKTNIFSKKPVLVSSIVLLALLLIFYHQIMFGGKTFESPDKATSWANFNFAHHVIETEGLIPLWCPYIFSGMPSYGSMLSVPMVNFIDYVVRWILVNPTQKFQPEPFTFILLNYLFFGLLMYALMRHLKTAPIVALFAGVAVIFLPQFIAFTAYGHNTKFLAVVLIPLIFLLADRLLERKNMLYFCLTALAIGFQMMRVHVQVSFYTFLMLGIYFIFKLVSDLKEKKGMGSVLTSGGLLLGAIVMGVLLSSVIYVSVLDYQQYSIRGGGESGGLDFDYASSWSFHPLEMVTFIIPSFMGFGGQTYWGKMPFTDYPLYFSVIILLLAGLALVIRRNKMTWFFAMLAIFCLLVSFGKHLPILYTPMFKLLPYFNKFRIPSMIHIILDISLIVLAGFALQGLIERKAGEGGKQVKKYLTIFASGIGLIALFVIFGKSILLELIRESRPSINAAAQNEAYEMAVRDSFKALIFVGIAVFLVLQYLKEKMPGRIFGLSLAILVLVDLWFVDFKIIQPQPVPVAKQHFQPTPAVNFLEKDKSLFRIYPAIDAHGGNWYMWFLIQSINGYHPAKLRIYQEFLEATGYDSNSFIAKYWSQVMRNGRPSWMPVPPEQVDPNLLSFDYAMMDMMNAKYILSMGLPIPDPRFKEVLNYNTLYGSQNVDAWIYENTTVLPRAFFADAIEVLSGKDEIFKRMQNGSFDPRKTAILEEAQPFEIVPTDSNRVSIGSYSVHRIDLDASIVKPAILVLSEIYYPAGWKAYVDGKETKIFKTNYILRSVFLEPGEYKIEFVFSPATFKIGVWISLVTLFTLLTPLAFIIFGKLRKKNMQPIRS